MVKLFTKSRRAVWDRGGKFITCRLDPASHKLAATFRGPYNLRGRCPTVLRRRLIRFAGIPICLLLLGTFGYYLVEWPRYTLFDGLYMTVITLTTVGYEEVHHPLSTAGRVFTILLLLGGVFLL